MAGTVQLLYTYWISVDYLLTQRCPTEVQYMEFNEKLSLLCPVEPFSGK